MAKSTDVIEKAKRSAIRFLEKLLATQRHCEKCTI